MSHLVSPIKEICCFHVFVVGRNVPLGITKSNILYVFEAKIRFSKIFIPNLGKFSLSKYINSAWPYGKTRQARMLIIDSTDH